MKTLFLAGFLAFVAVSSPVVAQEPVIAAQNADQLFTSPDPMLNANKQVVYRIMRDLLDAGHWDKAGELLSDEYVQRNPNTQVLKVQPRPIPEKLSMKIVAVMAEGDLVTVLYPRTVKDAQAPGGTYSTTWFDTWRIKDGKAVEHWDPALLNEAPDLR
ncbi:UNVERIFIED_ORG: putative SnoaL-like aldol condensation-catalyzing enzyme [Shinella zoogloeoides]|nr:putative SnoaL-like aldol condensation-catalyzing enzyme [Shinella zoogloeoides]